MKAYGTAFVVMAAVILVAGLSVVAVDRDIATSDMELAFVEFTDPVKMGKALLKGSYIFAHRDTTNEEYGCLVVYKIKDGKPGDLVVTIHCERENREMADNFQIRTVQVFPTLKEIKEVQFAGYSYGHRIP